ncbi:MAG TPA: hypothetical protein VF072_01320 [Thermoleophilaceae bacterium]
MSLSTAVRLAVLLAVLAIPAEALGASTVRTSSVSGRLVVPGGGPRTLGLHCPSDAVALNGAITSKGRGVVVRSSMPGRGSGDWAFRVAVSGAGSRTVSAVLRCVALRLPEEFTQARLNVKTQRRNDVVIAPGATATTEVACGRRWTATGYGLRGGARGDVRFAEVVPSAHSWRFTLENTGPSTVRPTVTGRCLRSKVTARGPGSSGELRFRTRRRSFSTVLPPGPGQIDATACGAGLFSVGAGGSLDAASTKELVIASPVRQRGGRWRFTGGSGDPFKGYMVCLSRASRFR